MFDFERLRIRDLKDHLEKDLELIKQCTDYYFNKEDSKKFCVKTISRLQQSTEQYTKELIQILSDNID